VTENRLAQLGTDVLIAIWTLSFTPIILAAVRSRFFEPELLTVRTIQNLAIQEQWPFARRVTDL
jgi:hypothetical protein